MVTALPSPTIAMPMPMSLSGFTYVAGAGPSAAQSFTISGSYLTADLSLTAPAGYGISLTSGGTYTSTLTVPQTSGTVGSTTVYVILLTGQTVGSYSGNITISSTGATSVLSSSLYLSGDSGLPNLL